jgi:hypothetical protein
MTLISAHSHSFDTGIAKSLGLHAAIVYNHIIYWICHNAHKKDAELIDGKYWMYETQQQMADFLQYLTVDDVQKAVAKLLDSGLIIKNNFNKNSFDRTNWYSIPDQTLIKKTLTKPRNGGMETEKFRNPTRDVADCIYDHKNTHKEEQQQQGAATPLAAVSSVYEFLKTSPEPIPEDVMKSVSGSYPEERVKKALEFAIANQHKIQTTFVAYFLMACNKGLKVAEKKKQPSHYETLCKMFKHGEVYNGAECTLNPGAIGFQRGQNQKQVLFDEYFSFTRIEKLCEHFGIEMPKTT